MAISKTPTDYVTGYELVAAAGTVTAQSIAFPLTQLPSLSAAEANASTGDIREIARSLNEKFYQELQATPTVDRLTRFTVSKSEIPDVNNQNRRTITYTSTFIVDLDPTAFQMAAE